MTAEDPSLAPVLEEAPGYAVFPTVGEGGFLATGTGGVGVVYAHGDPIGFVELREGAVGPQIGGQTYSELVVFRTEEALDRLEADDVDLTADASATLVRSGAAAEATFEGGKAVFVDDERGLMAAAAVGVQSLTFVPRS